MSILVKPAVEGNKIRNPVTGKHVKPEGDTCEETSYWVRAKQRGDVTYETIPAPDAAGDGHEHN